MYNTDKPEQIIETLTAIKAHKWVENFKAELAKTEIVSQALEEAIPDYVPGWEVFMIANKDFTSPQAASGTGVSGIVELKNNQ